MQTGIWQQYSYVFDDGMANLLLQRSDTVACSRIQNSEFRTHDIAMNSIFRKLVDTYYDTCYNDICRGILNEKLFFKGNNKNNSR